MEYTIVKEKEKIEIYVNDKKIKKNKDCCFLIGNIYNLDDTSEKNILSLYHQYKDKLFNKLNGEYILILIIDKQVIAVRDKIGSKLIYYGKIGNKNIISTSLKYFTTLTKEINKQVLANYLCYCYIKESDTILNDVYKLNAGSYIIINKKINVIKYYDLVKHYTENKNKIKNKNDAINVLTDALKESINLRVNNKKKIGILFSGGIDSSLLASLCKEYNNKEIHTFTVGFYEEERNEAIEARNMSKFLKTKHHEFYLDHNSAKKIIKDIPKIYSEPFGDPSLIPILFINKKIKNMDLVITGDGADQMYCGSNMYDHFTFYKIIRKKNISLLKKIYYLGKIYFSKYDCWNSRKTATQCFMDINPQNYYNFSEVSGKMQVRYMLLDIKYFLSNRLFSKVSFPASYYNISLAHPFIDDEVMDITLKIDHKYKYHKKEKKYILKKILFNKIPKELCSKKKKGFGIPLKQWLYEIYLDDIIKYSNEEILKKQNLFPVEKIQKQINKLRNNKLNNEECYIMFSYYMFQLWYQEYIEDLWK